MRSLHGQVSPLETRGLSCSQDFLVSVSIRRAASSGLNQTSSRLPSILFLTTHSFLGLPLLSKVKAEATSDMGICSLLHPWHLEEPWPSEKETESGLQNLGAIWGLMWSRSLRGAGHAPLGPDLESKQTHVGDKLLPCVHFFLLGAHDSSSSQTVRSSV